MSLNTGNAILSNAITVDGSYRVGIGITPSSWSGFNTLQVGALGLWSTSANNSHFSSNLYYDGTDRRYIATDYALEYNQQSGVHKWLYAASGTAGAVATLTEAMRITSSGNVGIGISSPTSLIHAYSSTTGTQVIANFAAANYGSSSSRTYIQIGTQYGDGSSRIGSINTTGNQSALVFQTQSASSGVWNDAMYINGSGNVGIGSTNPTARLDINNTSGDANLFLGSPTGSGSFIKLFNNSVGKWFIGTNATGSPDNDLAIYGYGGQNGNIISYTNGAERMRITSGGVICMNTTTAAGTLSLKAQSDNRAIFLQNPNGADGSIWLYGASNSFDYKFSTWSQGSAFYLYNNGNYSFAGSNVSDRRLKQNIESITYNAIEKIMQLVPKSYNMVAQPEINRNGFIAQEVKEVLPDVITGTETDEEYLGLDYNGLLAVAIKAIQEQQAMIEAQQQQINQLINK